MNDLYPLTFEPIFKGYIWGGRNLERFGRQLPPDGIVAESWEIAGHEDGTTRVANGAYRGLQLTSLQAKLGLKLIGRNNVWAQKRDKFPLLIKLLDANQQLSVQVHPDDVYAQEHEGNELGKSEMWVVLAAEPGAQVILGVKAGTTPQTFRQAIEEGRLEPFLHRIPVKTGDHICVPAGSLHAILGGLVIAEIQQNSNTTYRVYDWNRKEADGKPRQLHVDQALDVINFKQVEPRLSPAELLDDQADFKRWRLCANAYFVTERVTLAPGGMFEGTLNGDTLEIWGVIEGQAWVNDTELNAVQFTLLPAALGSYRLVAVGPATLLRTYCPGSGE